MRDRAILLLLARLALRAGDIVALRLIDIDWDRAVIHVSGKSRRETALPLPQDVGDALCVYITTVRPRIDNRQLDEQKVFLGVRAPHRPFSNPGVVTKIARRALDRASVITFASRGAHVFRHSQATALLRSERPLKSSPRYSAYLPEYHHDLCQDGHGDVAGGRAARAGGGAQ